MKDFLKYATALLALLTLTIYMMVTDKTSVKVNGVCPCKCNKK